MCASCQSLLIWACRTTTFNKKCFYASHLDLSSIETLTGFLKIKQAQTPNNHKKNSALKFYGSCKKFAYDRNKHSPNLTPLSIQFIQVIFIFSPSIHCIFNCMYTFIFISKFNTYAATFSPTHRHWRRIVSDLVLFLNKYILALLNYCVVLFINNNCVSEWC